MLVYNVNDQASYDALETYLDEIRSLRRDMEAPHLFPSR